ncbi:MAG: ABC transporter permease [Verrucomicrobia bacterium]|nr:ABC transporter permease [Verrucomicrobiota bacterium]NBU09039.1 ABC transporter permease [Pseudomonadota bacterium]NDA65842.1 ABC transporter permease [Verrucomicrobiota bacterium]NDD37589.1 ABC transporter permease [Verrucomicrobiota bacterium]NDE97504.1 ABC transporter permease [Verrucomicrobiota bacterium]
MNLPTLSNWRTWEPNPIVVKELRQAVRSWAITGMLLVFLTILFFVTVGFLLGESFTINPNQALGRDIFQVFLPVLSVVGFFFIPIYVAGRLTAERQEGNVDMLYITTLSPARIIRGKLLCGIYLTVLFFSVCAPFMVFTNLLRGIDLPTVFVLLTIAFLLSVLSLQAAIFLSCLPASKGLKILVGAPSGMFMMSLVGMMVAMSSEMMREGVGSRLGTWDFWGPTLSALLLGLLLFGFFHLAAIALVSPPSANRALPLRAYLTGTWLLTLGVAVAWSVSGGSLEPMNSWSSVVTGGLIVALLIAVSEGDDVSLRIRRTIPINPMKRALAFFFYSGSAGGLAWACMLSVATVLLGALATQTDWLNLLGSAAAGRGRAAWVTTGDEFFFAWVPGVLFLYTLAYALFGLFIHRRFQPHRSPIFAGLCSVALPALWAIVPNLVLFFVNRLSWDALQERQLGNIFNVFALKDRAFIADHQLCAVFLAALGLVINLSWFRQQLHAFQPVPRAEPAAPVTPPPL